MAFYLVIVSPLDAPLFELQFTSQKPGTSTALSGSATFPSWSTFTGSNGSDLGSAASAAGTPSTAASGTSASASGTSATPNTAATVTGTFAAQQAASQSAQQQQQQQQQQSVGVARGAPGDRHLLQMVAHAALDAVEEAAEGSGSLYLKAVDKHNEWTVSAFLATNVKLLLLHDLKNDDGIRLFLGDVWELWTKILLNPFHTVNTPIRNPAFEAKVRMSAKKHL